jgi:hypothetical protein
MPLYPPFPIPLTVALGGTGDTGTAWSSGAATVGFGGGATGTVSGTLRSRTVGKLYFFQVTISATSITASPANSDIRVTLPVTTAAANSLVAINLTTNALCLGRINASGTVLAIVKYDGSFPAVTGDSLAVSGVIEIA